MDSPHFTLCFGFCCSALHPHKALDFSYPWILPSHFFGFLFQHLDLFGCSYRLMILVCCHFHHHLKKSPGMPRLSIDLFSSLPGILLSFGHFVHRKRATSEHLAESHEQPVQCMIRGDLKNMEYNCPPIPHMYRPFLLVVHFISSCIFGSRLKRRLPFGLGLITQTSIIVNIFVDNCDFGSFGDIHAVNDA